MLEQLKTIDRIATLYLNGGSNMMWDNSILVATSTWMWIPLGVIILWLIWRDTSRRNFWFIVLFLVIGVFVADNLSASVFKPIFKRWRLTQDPIFMYVVDVVHNYRGGRYSFFSAHAANTFTVETFLCLLVRRPLLNLLIVSWALLNCYTRVYLGVHYIGDILVGIYFGILIGWTCYKMFCYFSHYSPDRSVSLLKSRSRQILAISIWGSYVGVFIVALLF